MRYVFVDGLRYRGESEPQAQDRERLMREHNARQDAIEQLNSLPMEPYRSWAKARGLI